MKTLDFIIKIIINIFTSMGFGFVGLVLFLSALSVIGYEAEHYLWIHYLSKAYGWKFLGLGIIAVVYILISIMIASWLIKRTIKNYWQSIKELKKDCWDDLSGPVANFIARILKKDKEFE